MIKKKSWFADLHAGQKILFILFIAGVLSASIFLFIKIYHSDRKVVHLYFLPLLLGLIFEHRRIAGKWKPVIGTAIGAYLFSFFAFSKGKSERSYVFEDHLQMWPYFFLGFFVLIAMVLQYLQATKRMTEGISLLLTIAINYWIMANDYWNTGSLFIKILIIINVCLSLFSLFHSLSYTALGKGTRLALSIWCSIIVFILSVDNFLDIYKNKDIELLPTLSDSLLACGQFFLLGISSIYIAQNLTMIFAYFPGKDYLTTVRAMNDLHVDRFSDEQVYISDSIVVIIISCTVFALNLFYHFLPVNFIIWLLVTITPLLLYLLHRFFGK